MSDDLTGELVRRAQHGEASAAEALFRRYLPRVRQIVALRLGVRPSCVHSVDDHLQDALIHVLERLDRYEMTSEGSFRHWVATCVANCVRNGVRAERAAKRGGGRIVRFGELGDDDLPAAVFRGRAPTASAVYAGKEALERIEEALLALDEREREVIVLRRLCEMTYEEIAAAQGTTVVAARQVFHRAIRRLEEACAFASRRRDR